MTSADPPEDPIDLHKLRAALDVLTVSFSVRGRRLRIAPEHLVFETALVGSGCFGTWPDIQPLVQGLRNYSSHLGQSEEQTFDAFDQFLDWLVEQRPAIDENSW